MDASNAGTASWPAPVEFGAPSPFGVRLMMRWSRSDANSGGGTVPAPFDMPLRRDVPSGESLRQSVLLAAPKQPGVYDIEIALHQVDGARFEAPGNMPLRARVSILPPAAR